METHPQRPGRFGLCFFHYFSAWDAMLRDDKLRAYQQQKMALRTAIEVYHRCSKALLGTLKIEPSGETKAIYEQLLKLPQ